MKYQTGFLITTLPTLINYQNKLTMFSSWIGNEWTGHYQNPEQSHTNTILNGKNNLESGRHN